MGGAFLQSSCQTLLSLQVLCKDNDCRVLIRQTSHTILYAWRGARGRVFDTSCDVDVTREVDMFILATVHLRNYKNSMRTLQCLFIMLCQLLQQ